MVGLAVKDAVLQALEQARGERLSGGRLAEQLGVSRAAVHKAIGVLRGEGLAIDGVPGEGYRLAPDDDSLTAAGISALLDTGFIGRDMLVVPSLTSTNTVMKERYLGRPHGFVLLAEEQTGGRGRLGRPFASPAGTGVYQTILLHPTLPLAHIQFVTIAAAVAVAEAIEQTADFAPADQVGQRRADGGPQAVRHPDRGHDRGRNRHGPFAWWSASASTCAPTRAGRTRCVPCGGALRVRPDAAPRRSWRLPSCRALSALTPARAGAGSRAAPALPGAACAASADRSRSSARPRGKYEAECTGLDENGHLLVRDAEGRRARCPPARSASGCDPLSPFRRGKNRDRQN